MKTALILTCYDRIDDLLSHLDIMSFCEIPHDIKIIYSGSEPLNIEHIYLPPPPLDKTIWPAGSVRASRGAANAFLCGLQWCLDNNYEAMVYRNGDDWMFRHDLFAMRLELLKKFDVVGYNWFKKNVNDNVALNELYLKVEPFKECKIAIDFVENCEGSIASFLKITDSNFYRLADREIEDGIGNDWQSAISNNNRHFNLYWQLITAHDYQVRYELYQKLRPFIPYAEKLEKKEYFSSWLIKYGKTK